MPRAGIGTLYKCNSLINTCRKPEEATQEHRDSNFVEIESIESEIIHMISWGGVFFRTNYFCWYFSKKCF